MSSLNRYKKSGGFNQLLSLIESFGAAKKEKFIEMIETESPVWAQAIREKMLTLERILGWPDDNVITVFKKLQPKALAFALEGLDPKQKTRISSTFSPSEVRRLSDILSESKPKAEEIASTLFKMVDIARKMIKDRELYVEQFDPTLLVPEDYEAKLEEQSSVAYGVRAVEESENSALKTAAGEPVVSSTHSGLSAELQQLQRSLGLVLKENKALKEELAMLKDRLDQIKRIA